MLGEIIDCPNCKRSIEIQECTTNIQSPSQLSTPKTKSCPFCAEDIRTDAIKCKHCGEMLNPDIKQQEQSKDCNQVVITGIKIPFWAMVSFIVNLAIASIPALIILILLWELIFAFIGGLMGS